MMVGDIRLNMTRAEETTNRGGVSGQLLKARGLVISPLAWKEHLVQRTLSPLRLLAGTLFYDQGPPCTPVGLTVSTPFYDWLGRQTCSRLGKDWVWGGPSLRFASTLFALAVNIVWLQAWPVFLSGHSFSCSRSSVSRYLCTQHLRFFSSCIIKSPFGLSGIVISSCLS